MSGRSTWLILAALAGCAEGPLGEPTGKTADDVVAPSSAEPPVVISASTASAVATDGAPPALVPPVPAPPPRRLDCELGKQLARIDLAGGAEAIDILDDGTVLVTGRFRNAMQLGGRSVKGQGDGDNYVASFAPDGKQHWGHHIGGKGIDWAYDIVGDGSGRAIAVGTFRQRVRLGGRVHDVGNDETAYVVVYDRQGRYVWDRRFPGKASAVAVDDGGNVYVGGMLARRADLGGERRDPGPEFNAIVVSYDPSGRYRWDHVMPGSTPGQSVVEALAVGAAPKQIVATGYFTHTATIGGRQMRAVGGIDGFVTALAPANGKPRWGTQLSADSVTPNAIAVDAAGDLYVGGSFNGTPSYDGLAKPTQDTDGFVASLTAAGAFRWQWRLTSDDVEHVMDLSPVEPAGVIAVGMVGASVDLGAGPVDIVGARDPIVVVLDRTGQPVASHNFAGPKMDWAGAVAVTARGSWVSYAADPHHSLRLMCMP